MVQPLKTLQASPIAIIVIAQLFGTSLWFSPNSAATSLTLQWGLTVAELGQLTSATQLGFIAGTLLLATTGLADRFAASRIFAISAVLGALFNLLFALIATGLDQGLVWRFLVGVSLAGIYPLGMKMIISWSPNNTGTTLGLLVAMLTLGSALPHGVRAVGIAWAWEVVVLCSSGLALLGALLIYLLGDGPHLPPAKRQRLQWGAVLKVFADARFRASASGYFGHMWELYAFWTLLPLLVADLMRDVTSALTNEVAAAPNLGLSAALSFLVMGCMGAVGAMAAGRLSQRHGSPKVAAVALLMSGSMCLIYPLVSDDWWPLKLAVLLIWGLTVVSDSAQFSATSASLCPPQLVGGALAIQNSIGFLISTVSIVIVMAQYQALGDWVVWYLLPGPVLGLFLFRRLIRSGITKPHLG